MNEISKVDEIMKLGAIVAIALWAAHTGFKKGKEACKHDFDRGYGVGYARGFEEGMKEQK